ncbi:MauE/DoxX family redox-associated membrane protein [Paenibacillus marinisediminis]
MEIAFAYSINLLIALLFSLSFISKIKEIKNFKFEIISYILAPEILITLLVYIILFLEFFFIVAFSTGILQITKEIIAIITLLIFTWFTWRKNRKSKTNTCSCFGSIGFLNKFPLLRNFMILSLLVIGLYLPRYTVDLSSAINSIILVINISLSIEIGQIIFLQRKRRSNGKSSDIL